jgi:hypothetical protein
MLQSLNQLVYILNVTAADGCTSKERESRIRGKVTEMNVYEAILAILEKKGPATIPSLCQEMNELTGRLQDKDLIVDPFHLKSIIHRKKEWFLLNGDVVSIRPDKDIVKLTAVLNGYPGPEVKIIADFERNTFVYFEWHFDKRKTCPLKLLERKDTMEQFRKNLYDVHIWDWEEDYQAEGIIVDGTGWLVIMETKGGIYKREGLEAFPKEWKKFCRALRRLTGVHIK